MGAVLASSKRGAGARGRVFGGIVPRQGLRGGPFICQRTTSAYVTGFGRRPFTDLATRATRPASESRQGTESREMGRSFSADAMGIWLARSAPRARVEPLDDVASGSFAVGFGAEVPNYCCMAHVEQVL